MKREHEWYTDPRYAPKSEPALRRCEMDGCAEHGEYKAPKTPGGNEYLWFCLPHVQAYNKKWNYFANMSPAEVEHFQREAVTGHRPTWKMGTFVGKNGKTANERLEQKLFEFLHQRAPKDADLPPASRILKPKFRRALEMLGVEWPITAENLKKSYKQLAKRLHPDMNPDDQAATERFKEVTQAYHVLTRAMDDGEI